MKTREAAARFIERQLHWTHKCSISKPSNWHYGLQELRELMDFIYESPPTEAERITKLDIDSKPDA
jgi:hypothetical protein